jgi:fructose/tagatose bisphosphate aldolase
MRLRKFVDFSPTPPRVKDPEGLLLELDGLLREAVFEPDAGRKQALLLALKEVAKAQGVVPASIQPLYEAMARDYPGFSVPAMNLRGLTYEAARAAFRAALAAQAGAFIFEIARSEIGYTAQRPLEYSTVILCAALREGYRGPVFIQADHFQFVRRHYEADPEAETSYLKRLIQEALEAEFYQIDIDASTLVDLSRASPEEQQRPNYTLTAQMAAFIRSLQPRGITVCIGGEIGEIGGRNSTAEELRAFLRGFNQVFGGRPGLSKLSIQTGTTHGGVVLPDGSLAQVQIDFKTLQELSEIARREFGLSGCVQHGASTLPEEAFSLFPQAGASEVHLATGFQNIIYEALPQELRQEVYGFIKEHFGKEWTQGMTEEQFLYKTRKKAFGAMKQWWWGLPEELKAEIARKLQARFALLYDRLGVAGTAQMVRELVRPPLLPRRLPL